MNPYLITGPPLVSFSGGRTSGFMLHKIIEAHGRRLPDDVMVAFANTGKEREETLRFVHECGSRWGVEIAWLEWRRGRPGFERVGFNSASRDGEPFEDLIRWKQRLPNWQERWCTSFLKVEPLTAFARGAFGGRGACKPGDFIEVVGLRHDEGHRVLKGLGNAQRQGRKMLYPLANAGVTAAAVRAFWNEQPFDLGLEPWEGNCDLCFMKGRGIKKRIIRDEPARADWWSRQESEHKGAQERGWFDRRDSIAGLVAEVAQSPTLFDPIEAHEYDVECGDACGGDSPAEVSAMQRVYENTRGRAA